MDNMDHAESETDAVLRLADSLATINNNLNTVLAASKVNGLYICLYLVHFNKTLALVCSPLDALVHA